MKSMTGYGNASFSSEEYDLDIGIKTVNGRFLDIRFHMPREYIALEGEFKKLIQTKISRGTVDIYIQKKWGPASSKLRAVPHKELAKQWLSAYDLIAKDLNQEAGNPMDILVRIPEIIELQEQKKVTYQERKTAIQTIKEALENCYEVKVREGEDLRQELQKQFGKLSKIVSKIEKLRAKANKELAKRFKEKIEAYELKEKVDENRLAQEVAFQIDRSDITEEVVRLNQHISGCEDLVSDSKSHGKKLDFFAQELLREVNTIGSKSQVSDLTHNVVEAKTIVERIREQVQNIE